MAAAQTVLIVEDDGPLRRSLRRHLVSRRHRVLEAGGVHEALALLETGDARVVLTDLCLSDGSGLAVISAAREAGLDVLAMTATSHLPDEARARGALACLPKPFPVALLDEWLERLAKRSESAP
ncbi:MAG: response regulator [Deltaproteobacteria bacterium]|nr:response regulator [Deltaproteobacteria bacterium]